MAPPASLGSPGRLAALPPLLLALDLALLGLYLLDNLLGHPIGVLESFWDLDRESNLPTWYSSTKLFLLALLLGWFARARWGTDGWRAWLVAGAALLALVLSLDETALLHERIGVVLLPYDQREGTIFREGGSWITVLAPLLLIAALVLWRYGLRDYARAAPGAALRLVLGFGLLLVGAAGVELFRYFSVDAWWHPLQVALEEGMELIGTTLMIAGAVRLVPEA